MRILCILLLIPLFFSCTSRLEKPLYRIYGEIEGLSNATVYLDRPGHRDTIIIENEKFLFSGSVSKPVLGKIVIEGIGGSREFYIENSDIEITGHIDSLDFLNVNGSITEEENVAYQAVLKVFDEEYAEIGREYKTANPERQAQLEEVYSQVELRQVEAQKLFVKQNPTSYLCIGIISEIDWSFNSAAEYDEYLSLLDSSLLQYDEAKYLFELVERMRLVEIDQIAPDFEMDDENGVSITLSEFIPGSELVLLDFWASTCGPCRIENVNIRKAYELFRSKGLEILGVSTDVRKEQWIQAIEKDGLIWKNVCSLEKWGDNEVVKKYALRQVSQNFLLGKNGIIIAKDLRGEDLISKLDELLN